MLALLAVLPALAAATPARPALVPQPARLVVRPGSFTFGPKTTIVAPAELRRTAELLQDALRPATGVPLPVVVPQGARGRNEVVLKLDRKLAPLGPEGYRLVVKAERVEVSAPAPAGVFHGTQTLRQLLPPESLRRALVPGVAWTVPCTEVEDRPRFPWRGSHLDVVRHFMPRSYLLAHLDRMALHKLNVFHWHLTDDQGWRLQVRKYPRLTEVGACRGGTQVGKDRNATDGVPHSGFFTQDDVREVVRYAADRFITVVPEIEMPGHAQAAIAAYPELGNTGAALPVWTSWGISEHVFNVEEPTFRFLEDVLSEVLELFPSLYIHVGGDEVPKTEWKGSERARARMQELGLATPEELQSWFVRRFDSFLSARGRRLLGWDEILEGGLAPGATVMSWRGEKGGIAAARAGHDVVMAPTTHTYLDYYQSKDVEEPLAIGGFVPLEKVYSYEPVPAELTPEEARHVLGAQAQLWTEYLRTPRQVDYMAWPRLAALAEVVWSPREAREWDGFLARLAVHARRLDALDVNRAALPGELPRR